MTASSAHTPDLMRYRNWKQTGLSWLWLALIVLVLDQASKQLALALLEYARPVAVLPVFDLTLLYNKGAAFSFLASESGWQRWLFSLIALGVSAYLLHWLYRNPPHGLAAQYCAGADCWRRAR